MDDEVRVTLRLPRVLHARLASQAKAAHRSLNSEITLRLETSPDPAVPGNGGSRSAYPCPAPQGPDSSPP